jgi:hypothetical protein
MIVSLPDYIAKLSANQQRRTNGEETRSDSLGVNIVNIANISIIRFMYYKDRQFTDHPDQFVYYKCGKHNFNK